VLYDLADGLRAVAVALFPYIPTTAPRLLDALRQSSDFGWDEVSYGRTPETTGIEPAEPLFPRIDPPAVAA